MYVRWLTDSAKYNEWMNPIDYELDEEAQNDVPLTEADEDMAEAHLEPASTQSKSGPARTPGMSGQIYSWQCQLQSAMHICCLMIVCSFQAMPGNFDWMQAVKFLHLTSYACTFSCLLDCTCTFASHWLVALSMRSAQMRQDLLRPRFHTLRCMHKVYDSCSM